MQSLDDHQESLANADVLVRAYPCTTCKAIESVVDECENGIYYGICTICKTKYLDPDWDAMGKDVI